MDRAKVYELIDNERDYQNKKWLHSDDESHNVSDWLIFIEGHLNRAKNKIYNISDVEALEEIRKIAALCVAAIGYCIFVIALVVIVMLVV